MKTRHVIELLESVTTLEQQVSELLKKVRELDAAMGFMKDEIESLKTPTPRATPVKKSTK